MYTLLVILHVLFCVFLILVILLQTGRGGGMGTAFGGASQTVFGPRGAGSFVGKITAVVAGLFMVSSVLLAYLSSSGSSGVASKVQALNDQRAKDVENVDLKSFDKPAPAPEPIQEPVKDAGVAAANKDAGAEKAESPVPPAPVPAP